MYGPLRGLQVPPVQFSTRVNLRASTGYLQDVLRLCTCECLFVTSPNSKSGHTYELRFVVLLSCNVVNVEQIIRFWFQKEV